MYILNAEVALMTVWVAFLKISENLFLLMHNITTDLTFKIQTLKLTLDP